MNMKKIRDKLSIILSLLGATSLLICGTIHLINNCENLSLLNNPSTITVVYSVTLMKIMIGSWISLMVGLMLMLGNHE